MTALLRLTALHLVALVASPALADDETPTYERDIRPVLAKRCTVCHSAKTVDNHDVSAGLALDTYESVLKGVPGRAVVVPGKASASPFVARLADTDEDRRMPLSDRPLSEGDQKRFARWVDAGAPRGTPVASAAVSVAAVRPKRRLARSLDVAIPVETRIPSGVKDIPAGGPAQSRPQGRAAPLGHVRGLPGRRSAPGRRHERLGRALGPRRGCAGPRARRPPRPGARLDVQPRRPPTGCRHGGTGPIRAGKVPTFPAAHSFMSSRAILTLSSDWPSAPTAASSPRPR
ncbi:MAG: c-type cytochrome domain-containing protein [Isosphaeraceae bacterium]